MEATVRVIALRNTFLPSCLFCTLRANYIFITMCCIIYYLLTCLHAGKMQTRLHPFLLPCVVHLVFLDWNCPTKYIVAS